MPGLFLVAAAALIRRDDGCVLLVRRSAHRHAPGEWETPNGRVESGETVLDALHREVAEETGLAVEAIRPVDTWRLVRGVERQEMIGITYLCRCIGASDVRLSDEHDDHRWADPAAAAALVQAPALRAVLLRLVDGARATASS